MFRYLKCLSPLAVLLCLSLRADESSSKLFDFEDASDLSQWRIVNDGVMGGRSSSQAKLARTKSTEQSGESAGVMQFSGRLSLANNGGFASVRSQPQASLGLQTGKSIRIRVLGDGRTYTFNLYTPSRRTAFSYQLKFPTRAGQWVEVKLPIDKFVAHSFGRPIPSMKLDPKQVSALGILLGDKKEGAFELFVDWIKVE